MSVTRKDVAKLSGVSTATVSNVLNNSAQVSPQTRERVIAAIKELNYVPNMVARSLSTSSSQQISVIVDNINNPYYGEIVSLFEKQAIEKNYFVNICTKPQYIDQYFHHICSRQIDGLLLLLVPSEQMTEKIYYLSEQGICIAASGYFSADESKISLIDPDFESGMLEAVRFLKVYGHKMIVYLSCFREDCIFDTRVKSFKAAIDSIFGDKSESYIFAPRNENLISNEKTGYDLTCRLVESGNTFTAIITTGDMMAIGCMYALIDHGILVPDDVSVMGIDGIELGEFVRPSLTTLKLDKEDLANKALNAILTEINTGKKTFCKSGFSIVERESVTHVRL